MKKERTEYLPLRRSEDLTTQQLADETLIYDFQTDKAYCLNHSSAMVWNACDGGKTIADISRELTAELNSAVTEDFVYLALGNLQKAGLLANGKQLTGNLTGVSRREAIRRVGLTTAVALPLISALLVPTAAEAASGCFVTGTPCPDIGLFYIQYPYSACCSGYCSSLLYYNYFFCS